jgi:hypothetical protein
MKNELKEKNRLVSRSEAARQFGCCIRTLKRKEKPLGPLTPFRLSARLVAYPARELEKMLADARAVSAGESKTAPATAPARPCRSRSKRTSRK